jgi:hypothetical protein
VNSFFSPSFRDLFFRSLSLPIVGLFSPSLFIYSLHFRLFGFFMCISLIGIYSHCFCFVPLHSLAYPAIHCHTSVHFSPFPSFVAMSRSFVSLRVTFPFCLIPDISVLGDRQCGVSVLRRLDEVVNLYPALECMPQMDL